MTLQAKVRLRKKEIIQVIGSQLAKLDACKFSESPDGSTIRTLWQLADHITDILENRRTLQ